MNQTLKKVQARWRSLHLITRFAIAFYVLVLFSFFSFRLVYARYEVGNTMRGKFCYFLARAIQAQSTNVLAAGAQFLQSISEDLAEIGWEVWITDEKGEVLSSSQAHPLPLDWELIPHPAEEYVLKWAPRKNSPINNVSIIRLVSSPPRFLVFFADHKQSYYKMIMKMIVIAGSWLVLLPLITLILLSWEGRSKKAVSFGNSGFSLLATVMALAIAGIAFLAVTSIFKISAVNLGHTNTRMAIASLSDTVRTSVDCEQTKMKNALVPVKDCDPNSLKALQLYDSGGKALTASFFSIGKLENFDPFDPSEKGSARLGNWNLRAYCDKASNSLIVRFARVEGEGFYRDPLTKRPYDWFDSSVNPLFGTPDRVICKGFADSAIGGGASQIQSAPLKALSFVGQDCTPSLSKNYKLYLAAVGAPEYIPLIPDFTLVGATIACPSGTVAMGGGANCGTGFSTASFIAKFGGSGNVPGSIVRSEPSADGSSWTIQCCVEGSPKNDGIGYAVCLPKGN